MRTGEIIVSEVSGFGNKIYKPGDPVTERMFPIGNFDRLVKDGFIKEKVEAAPPPKTEQKRKK